MLQVGFDAVLFSPVLLCSVLILSVAVLLCSAAVLFALCISAMMTGSFVKSLRHCPQDLATMSQRLSHSAYLPATATDLLLYDTKFFTPGIHELPVLRNSLLAVSRWLQCKNLSQDAREHESCCEVKTIYGLPALGMEDIVT